MWVKEQQAAGNFFPSMSSDSLVASLFFALSRFNKDDDEINAK
jgi:hypothetical protein